jgi:uncharacterized caspase-like protein
MALISSCRSVPTSSERPISRRARFVRRIADRLSAAGNQLNILILDACRDNPFPESVAPRGITGLVPMGAALGEFIASSTGSGKAAFDGDDGHSPYARALADAISAPGEKLEDVFKSVRRQVRLATGERRSPGNRPRSSSTSISCPQCRRHRPPRSFWPPRTRPRISRCSIS